MDVVAVPETIQEKLGSKGANDLIWLINQIITKQRLSIEHVELRFEHLLSREIGKLRIEFKTDLSKLREEISQNNASLEGKITQNTAALREEMAQNTAALRGEMAQINVSLREEMTRNKASLQQEIAQINVSLQGTITQNTAALREEIALLDKRVAENNANLIKWMFIFWVGQVGVMIGILFAFFK